MNSIQGWGCLLSSWLLVGTARAQTAAQQGYPPPYLAHVSILAAPSTELEVVPNSAARGSPPVARCTEYCDFWTPPGKYTVHARDPISGERKELSLRVKQSSRFELDPGDDEARATGFAVAMGGSAAVLAGLVLVMPVLVSRWCDEDCVTSKNQRDTAGVGLGLILAGMITSPIGWIIYGNNRARLVRIDERSRLATEAQKQVRVGVVGVGPGGLGLGAVATF
jgi:hypothetical protein